MRVALLVALAALLLAAGCIGSSDEALEQESAEDPLGDLASTGVGWETSMATPATPETARLNATLPGPAGAVFAEVTARIGEPGATLTATLEHPDGSTYALVDATAASGNATVEDFAVLPGYDGNATLTVEPRADGEASLRVQLSAVSPEPAPEPVATNGSAARPVVAVVDTGVNPYHEAFQRAGLATEDLPARIEADGSGPVTLDLDPGEAYVPSIREDAAVWAQAPSQQLFHVDGTNLMGIDLRERELPELPVLDRAGHGTAVAHAVSRENPETLVVMITAEDYDDGVRWAAEQPWVDLISLSWGPVVNAAGAAEPYATGFDTYDATRAAHEQGQLVFTATGNDPTPAFTDTTSGPPWVHAVSGAEPEGKGRAVASGNLVDTVANWTQTLAAHDSTDGTITGSGTSFATPTTAGIAAAVLHEVRLEAGHEGDLSDGPLVDGDLQRGAGDLREALNRTAVYWDTTAYEDPREGPSAPVAPTPWASMGWGYLDGSAVAPAVDGLLGDEPLPEKSDEAQAFMEANEDLRRTWWSVDRPPSG